MWSLLCRDVRSEAKFHPGEKRVLSPNQRFYRLLSSSASCDDCLRIYPARNGRGGQNRRERFNGGRDALRELAGRFDKLILEDTPIELYEANLAFHYRPLSLCGNSELVKLVTEIRQRTSSAPVSQWKTRARIEQSSREHHEMVNTIAAGKTAALKDTISRHIRQR